MRDDVGVAPGPALEVGRGDHAAVGSEGEAALRDPPARPAAAGRPAAPRRGAAAGLGRRRLLARAARSAAGSGVAAACAQASAGAAAIATASSAAPGEAGRVSRAMPTDFHRAEPLARCQRYTNRGHLRHPASCPRRDGGARASGCKKQVMSSHHLFLRAALLGGALAIPAIVASCAAGNELGTRHHELVVGRVDDELDDIDRVDIERVVFVVGDERVVCLVNLVVRRRRGDRAAARARARAGPAAPEERAAAAGPGGVSVDGGNDAGNDAGDGGGNDAGDDGGNDAGNPTGTVVLLAGRRRDDPRGRVSPGGRLVDDDSSPT